MKEFELANKTIAGSAFIEKWPTIGPQLRNLLNDHYKVKHFQTDWSEEIEAVLVLLKMFPARQVGRNVIASEATFRKAVEQFIHYEPVNQLTYN